MLALTPLIFFIIVYLVASIVAGDFYKVPITAAFMLTAIVSIIVSKGKMKERIETFSHGAGQKNMMLMIWIFILAGAFASSAKQMGSINDVVNLTLSLMPSWALLSGLFVAAAFISLSIGTSVGTSVALTPIAAGVAQTCDASVPLMVAIVVGGAFFGDNLSFISDTTVVATQSQGCRMSDKFRTNIRIALPAAIVMLIVYGVMGVNFNVPGSIPTVNYINVIPYLAVLILAVLGINVLVVLTIGCLLTGIIGYIIPSLTTGAYDSFGLYAWLGSMGEGILGMGELIIITMLAGGVLEMIRTNGGIQFIMDHILRHVHSQRTAELSIAALVASVDVCTANNTVAIITVSGIARDISKKYRLDPRRVASILDTFSCIMQGLIPYGAQLLMASALAAIAPVDIIPYLFYPYALAVCALAAILFHKQK